MRILFVGAADWANASNRIARSINAVAGSRIARVLTLQGPHPFGYDEDRPTADEVFAAAPSVEWVISTGDGSYEHLEHVLQHVPFRRDIKLATAHVGSAYRNASNYYNKTDQEYGFLIQFLGGDLFRFNPENPRAVPYFVPPHQIPSSIVPLTAPVRIAHSPSSRSIKGTNEILHALSDFHVDLIEKVSFAECNRRRAAAHIFIDQLNDLGGYGAAAIEALACGCATLSSTRNIHPKVCSFYPPPPILDIDHDSLRDTVTDLSTNLSRLQELRLRSHRWTTEHASPIAVGTYWLQHLSRAAIR